MPGLADRQGDMVEPGWRGAFGLERCELFKGVRLEFLQQWIQYRGLSRVLFYFLSVLNNCSRNGLEVLIYFHINSAFSSLMPAIKREG